MIYPFDSAQVLTDSIFTSYGGQTGTSTSFQREAAYFIAEEWMSNYLNTSIVPATITGTYAYPYIQSTVQLDYAYLQNVKTIKFLDNKDYAYYTITGLDNYHAAIRNPDRSIIDIFDIYGNCSACGNGIAPYKFQIVYEAGLPTGTYTAKNFLLALTEAAQIVVNEVQGWGNESSGGVGISEFRNQEYSEKRTPIIESVFGNSPKAKWITKLVQNIRKRMIVGL